MLTNIDYNCHSYLKHMLFLNSLRVSAASLFSRKQGLGVPSYKKNIYINLFLLLYLIGNIKINYIDCLLIACYIAY